MNQKEIEEKLKNFQVKHIEKPEKKEEMEKRILSDSKSRWCAGIFRTYRL